MKLRNTCVALAGGAILAAGAAFADAHPRPRGGNAPEHVLRAPERTLETGGLPPQADPGTSGPSERAPEKGATNPIADGVAKFGSDTAREARKEAERGVQDEVRDGVRGLVRGLFRN